MKENTLDTFECACMDRDHSIRAQHYVWDEENLHEVNFEFVMHKTCWEANKNYYGEDSILKEKWLDFTNFFRRIFWRLSKAWELLTTGSLRFTGDWMATEKELNAFRRWINKTCKLIKQQEGKLS